MRLAFTALLTLLFALAAYAGTGCKRPSGGAPTLLPVVVQQAAATALPAAAAETPGVTFVFCHPHAELLDKAVLSAAAAQVAFDTQANNDDRTEMIAFAADPQPVLAVMHLPAPMLGRSLPLPWLQGMLRPPRPTLA
ncbi:hypothetical protein [uncultured Xylophilus sp.]|uniref:hypothetical protein n=1 Tax=uncultured Xylophilus sp. TaxID=296832 RepID=UPI0025D44BB1|nr:hypothetical protein [uncultured Xylophilus sp.]